MSDPNGSLFASPQSMGASGSLPVTEVGAEEGELESHHIHGDDLPEEDSLDEEE